MPRYQLFIEFDGTRYCGWQIQPNARTIEEELEKALSKILRAEVDIIGQGRTDSGVHAEAQTAHVDLDRPPDTDQLLYALMGVLPRDISVWKMEEVPPDFHARFDARSRRYRYQIVRRASPLLRNHAALVLKELDLKAMQQCAAMVKGEHNFESFSKKDKDQSNAVCNVSVSEFNQKGHCIAYHVEANRFVRHMVRRLVGTMLQVGKGKCDMAHFEDLLHHPSPDKTSHGAAAKGLILEKVMY